VLARVVADGTPLPGGMIALFESPPGTGWTILSNPGGLLDGDFLKVGTAADFSQHGSNTHAPARISMQSSPPASGLMSFEQGGQNVAHYQHTHLATLDFEPADQRPPYREAIIAKLSPLACQ
jgi:hypothetical protein